MKVSASVYSARGKALTDLVQELDRYEIDFLHIDCKDDPAVFEDMAAIRSVSHTPFDVHIITATPERYFPLIESSGAEWVTFQYENLQGPLVIPDRLKASFGLAVVSETPIAVFEPYAGRMESFLLMATTPGESGQSFNKHNFGKVRAFKKQFPDKLLTVDGGVNAEVSFILRNLGVDAAVVGSYLFGKETPGHALLQLKSNRTSSQYHVRDFMMQEEDLPALNEAGLSFPAALQAIEDFGLGFILVRNEQGALSGMISNADIRRALLKNMNAPGKIDREEFLNRHPLSVSEDATIAEMMQCIKHARFPVSYLPVVNKSGTLTGVVTFNNLIKGEL